MFVFSVECTLFINLVLPLLLHHSYTLNTEHSESENSGGLFHLIAFFRALSKRIRWKRRWSHDTLFSFFLLLIRIWWKCYIIFEMSLIKSVWNVAAPQYNSFRFVMAVPNTKKDWKKKKNIRRQYLLLNCVPSDFRYGIECAMGSDGWRRMVDGKLLDRFFSLNSHFWYAK